jgi:hypothetical protein
MSVRRRMVSVILILYCAAFFVSGSSGQDSKKDAQLRTVHGIVLDKSENPVSESIVYLKNDRTNAVRTLYTDGSGKYRFSGLDPNADYEIYAEKDDSKSATRTVTSFDNRKDISLTLKIDRKKE